MVKGRAVVIADRLVEKSVAQQIQHPAGHQPAACGVGRAVGNDLLVHQLNRDGQIHNARNALRQVIRKHQADHQHRRDSPRRPTQHSTDHGHQHKRQTQVPTHQPMVAGQQNGVVVHRVGFGEHGAGQALGHFERGSTVLTKQIVRRVDQPALAANHGCASLTRSARLALSFAGVWLGKLL